METVQYTPLSSPLGTIYKSITNLMQFKVKVPPGYLGDLTVFVKNAHFDDNIVIDLCGLVLVEVGSNIPCLNIKQDVVYDFKVDNKTVDGQVMYRGMTANMSGVCYIHADHADDAAMLTLEVAVRLRDNIDNSTHGPGLNLITLEVEVIPVTPQLATKHLFNFTVATPNATDLTMDTIYPSEVDIEVNVNDFNALATGAIGNLDYKVTFPPFKTANVEMSILTPQQDGRAILTVSDLGFGPSPGQNVLCVGKHVDLPSIYPTYFEKTPLLTTFMQKDTATTDLGSITNAGWSFKQGNYNPPDDDQFSVRVKVQMTDHPNTKHNETHDVYLAIMFGDVIIVGE